MNESPAATALSVEGVKAAHFSVNIATGRVTGVVYDSETGIEFDVRETDSGWNVNDDDGRDFHAVGLGDALRAAIEANR